ncbi:isocitrate lyase/phosphoenolpyruvate mutase family protein [Streptomyces sp. NPDC006739]|uniref:isocitrate lyase/phosphoenolpyruvate mutase family protein n=1 Tax=Streptomyces sp. NPDC006739 TaxID=3364763 RepID=UPI0036962EFD
MPQQATFAPGVTGPDLIGALVRRLDVPLDILYSPSGPTVPQLAGLGVSRISLGSPLYRRALGAALDAMADIAAGREVSGGRATPTYADVQALAGGSAPASRSANSTG